MAAQKKANRTSLNAKVLDVYYEWYKTRHEGIPPLINGREGKAAKDLTAYFVTICTTKITNPTEDAIETGVIGLMEYVLNNFDKLEPFLRKQCKISQIMTNITNIIDQLKHGQPTNKKPVSIVSAFQKIDGHHPEPR